MGELGICVEKLWIYAICWRIMGGVGLDCKGYSLIPIYCYRFRDAMAATLRLTGEPLVTRWKVTSTGRIWLNLPGRRIYLSPLYIFTMSQGIYPFLERTAIHSHANEAKPSRQRPLINHHHAKIQAKPPNPEHRPTSQTPLLLEEEEINKS